MTQVNLRTSVITECRTLRLTDRMAKRDPSPRALAFKAWMAERSTNTKQVAAKSGVPYTTLASFVQGDTQSLKGDNEELISRAYDATPSEIFAGGAGNYVRIIGRVGADAEGTVIQTAAQETYDMAPIPPGGTRDSVALEVVGHSMRAIAEDGSLIYFEDQRNPPTPDMLGYYVICELEDGRVLFKRLLRGSAPNVFMLESQMGPPIEDVRVRWAAEPTAIIPPKQARRVIRRAGEQQVA